jgi:hypothetical protein
MNSSGQTAYEAYCKSSGGKSLISGAPLPAWDGLKPEIKTAWEAAGRANTAVFQRILRTIDDYGNSVSTPEATRYVLRILATYISVELKEAGIAP